MANIFGAARKCISIGEGFRVAVEIMMDYRKELKGTNSNVIGKVEKIEKEIKQLIELGSEIRMKVRDMKKMSRFAVMEGDSSYNSVGHFIEQVHDEEEEIMHFVVNGSHLSFGLRNFIVAIGLRCLQFLFCECCPGLNGRFADCKGSDVPRIMNWRIEKKRFSEDFFSTQVPKAEVGERNIGDGASSNGDLKKELEDFRRHIDGKFGEIFQAVGICRRN
ncbi:hypothetical protein FXO38_06636 [Capsicum annuum]|nr:hypothetical protein FXO37_30846 [Capsicum annuum]KAF3671318.1 hypothetical protein FXO38_06636 [Capsicum annuum]